MRFLIRVIYIFLISLLFTLVSKNFLSSEIFKIKKIHIDTNAKNLLRELTDVLKITYNKNSWELDLEQFQDLLKQDIRVKNVKITNSRLGELDVKIEARELTYYAQINDEIFLVDKDGVVFGYLNELPRKDTFLIVAKNSEEINKLLKIAEILDESSLKNLVSQIYMENNDLVILILLDGTKVKTNFNISEKKYKTVEVLYTNLVKNQKIDYIDIRFNDFIVRFEGDANEK